MKNEPIAYACWSKNKNIVNNSSSGGVFYELASTIINDYHGVVYGVVFEKAEVIHKRTETTEGLLPMLGSKYVRSNLNNCYQKCKDDLLNGRYVLFSGTPCQINGLHNYLDMLGINKERLVGVDLICHGTPKIESWKKYLELNFNSPENLSMSFRYKKEGWKHFFIKIGNYEAPLDEDPFGKAFLNNKILHESCFNCRCKAENRKADVTIGDFWGIENIYKKISNNKGVSLLMIRSKTKLLLSIILKKCKCFEVPYLESFYTYNSPYYKSVNKPDQVFLNNELVIQDSSLNQSKQDKNKKTIKNSFSQLFHAHDEHKKNVYVNKRKPRNNNWVGIITELGYVNNGNRLQNYALFFILRKYNKKPFNLYYEKHDYTFIHSLYNIIKRNKTPLPYIYNKSILLASKKYEGKLIPFSKTKRRQKRLCRFNTIIVGSDQVWNVNYHHYQNDLEFSLGNFSIINRPFKLYSYAASICSKSFSEDQKFLFKTCLNKFDKVTVREESSRVLLDGLGVNAKTVVDPTLLLTKEEWDTAIKKYSSLNIPNDKYCLAYVFENSSIDVSALGYKRLINCLDKNNYYYNSNQFDFVNLIKNADYVITNSFHALVFSIIYGKKVMLLKRYYKGMEERITNLIEMLDLKCEYDKEYDFSKINIKRLDKYVEQSLRDLLSFIS